MVPDAVMKIIYFSLDYTPHDHRFLSALSESEHQVYYVRLQRGIRQTEDRPVPENIEQVQWEGGKEVFRWSDLPKFVSGLRRVIRRIKPDLIHAGPIQTCAFIAILTGFRPVLTMSWGFDLMKDVDRSWWWRFATEFTLQRSAYFTSDAQVTCDKAIRFGMDPKRTVVFPWGVDLNYYCPEPREKPLGKSKGFTLFCNRSWEPNYGVDVLAQAFVDVSQRQSEMSLILLSGGSQSSLIRNTLERGGVMERVTLTGQISQRDLPRYYRMADLFISPSHVDGSSVSLMEALACGLPCLVSDIPANKEWVSESQNGWLFPDGNAQALASKLFEVFNGRKSLPQIGRAARAVAEERANWKENSRKLLRAYDAAVL